MKAGWCNDSIYYPRSNKHLPTLFFVNIKSPTILKKCLYCIIVHFTVACMVAKPFNRGEAKVDLVMIQTLLLFKCKLLCYHAN